MKDVVNLVASNYEALGLGAPVPQSKARDELGQDQFFKLMVTQLSHQDPLKPLDSDELLAQVAQFSTVGGIKNIERSIGDLVTSMESNQALQASTLVGRSVLVAGEIAQLQAGQPVRVAVDLAGSTATLGVRIATLAGEVVRRLELGPQSAGTVEFEWDGLDEGGDAAPDGRYVVSAVAGAGAEELPLGVLLARRVDSVSVGRNPPGITLNLEHSVSVGLDAVRRFF